mmetsp:Transcript_7706/g.11729  ORF Transcript_7706/g.11729 Transcript_7706/m.11729 type:complete len:102 (-) Transcript_7706:308-613(-)
MDNGKKKISYLLFNRMTMDSCLMPQRILFPYYRLAFFCNGTFVDGTLLPRRFSVTVFPCEAETGALPPPEVAPPPLADPPPPDATEAVLPCAPVPPLPPLT